MTDILVYGEWHDGYSGSAKRPRPFPPNVWSRFRLGQRTWCQFGELITARISRIQDVKVRGREGFGGEGIMHECVFSKRVECPKSRKIARIIIFAGPSGSAKLGAPSNRWTDRLVLNSISVCRIYKKSSLDEVCEPTWQYLNACKTK